MEKCLFEPLKVKISKKIIKIKVKIWTILHTISKAHIHWSLAIGAILLLKKCSDIKLSPGKWLRRRTPVPKVHCLNPAITWLKITSLFFVEARATTTWSRGAEPGSSDFPTPVQLSHASGVHAESVQLSHCVGLIRSLPC